MPLPDHSVDAVLFEGERDALLRCAQEVAALEGPIRPIFAVQPGPLSYPLDFLLAERSTSTNTAAAGGNAGLMALG